MRLVKQLDTLGCGLACVAMASGKPYREIRYTAFPDGNVKATTIKQLRSIMSLHGVTVGDRLIAFRTRRPEDLEFDALLKVNKRADGWHWVLWDCNRRTILDPKKPPYKRLRYVSYVRIEKA